ncbi:probable trehalose-phosphate phosphatase H [Bradysia coprophila]|uniref:probable trehalose-phosphate phosphatase H n=1 Tax=Bradysia coprophila TaxID=38358 RepID=UPI00187DC961|nr:probable trehalose-phosphate phosphatase H [Bradysia coprophila]
MTNIARSIDNYDDMSKILTDYIKDTKKVALLLDYDGTLAPISQHSDETNMDPYSVKFLNKLSLNPNIFIAFISGRGVVDVKSTIGIRNCTYAGNHGMEIIFRNRERWEYVLSDHLKEQFLGMIKAMDEAQLTAHGAYVENKGTSISYHYNEVPLEYQEELTNKARQIIRSFDFVANEAKGVIEGNAPVDWNKGNAALLILEKEFGDDWKSFVRVIFAGDDTTDENAMKSLKGNAISFRISDLLKEETAADYLLPSTNAVSYLLQWLESKFFHHSFSDLPSSQQR